MRSICCLALLGALLAFAPAASGDGPDATAAKDCRVGDTRSYGTSYVTDIDVRNTSCRSGRRVVRAFHDCRPGKAGRCNRRVLGYSCSEGKRETGGTQYYAHVVCRNGSKRVSHDYSQFT
jgi:hypothetical protein